MSKKSSVETNNRRQKMSKKYASKRIALKELIMNKETSPEDRFQAALRFSKLPRNSSPNRYRNRCALTGRPRGYYRLFSVSRIALRELASRGNVPGVTKSSW